MANSKITVEENVVSVSSIDLYGGVTGATGPQGPAGPSGPKGEKGIMGPAGTTGATGATGATGTPGSDGADGADGIDGIDGAGVWGEITGTLSDQTDLQDALDAAGGGGAGLAPYVNYMAIAYLEPSEVRTFEIIGDNFDDSTTVVPRVDEGLTHVVVDTVTAISGTKLEVTVTTDASFVDCYFDVYNGELLHFGTGLWIGGISGTTDFVFEILPTTANYNYKLATKTGYNYNFTVDWGDGSPIDTITAWNQAEIYHVYVIPKFYTITISGLAECWYKTNGYNIVKRVHNLGHMGWLNLESAFAFESKMDKFTAGNCDTSAVTTMKSMFNSCTTNKVIDVSTMDVSSVTNFDSCFTSCACAELDVNTWDTGSAQSMISMFLNCGARTLNVGNLDTSNVTSTASMFYSSSANTLDVNNFDLTNVTDIGDMFYNCSNLSSIDVSNWDTTNVTRMDKTFKFCTLLDTIDISNFSVSNVVTMEGMFHLCSSLKTINTGAAFNMTSCTSTLSMFEDCVQLSTIDLSTWNAPLLTNPSLMFIGCNSLVSANVDNFITNSVTTLNSMFRECNSLSAIDVSTWDVTNVTLFSYLFRECFSLTSLDFTGWTTPSLTHVSGMFEQTSGLATLDLSMFNMSKVVNMDYMFHDNVGVTSVDMTGWDTSKVTSVREFADGATNYDPELAGWDIGLIVNFTYFLRNSAHSQANYDPLLTAWAAQSPVSPSEAVHFGTAQYSPSKQADRDILDFAPNNWTITDGGVGDELVVPIVPGDGTTAWQGTSTHTWGEGITTQTEIASAWYKGGYFDSLPAATDGEVFCKGDGTEMVIGLTIDPNTGTNANNLDFALYFKGTTEMWVTERNGISATLKTTRISTDEFSIRRTGSTIEYLKNGTVFYTSLATINIDAELSVDTWTYATNHNIHSIRLEV